MTTILRRPLATRQADQPAWAHKLVSPLASSSLRVQSTTASKRPRSPDPEETIHASNIKRIKPTSNHTASLAVTTSHNTGTHVANTRDPDPRERKDKLRHREKREEAEKEFVAKYTKAFPSFVFYFDGRDGGRQQVESRVITLGARIDHFFSSAVTHVITNCPQPPKSEQYDPTNKENATPRPLTTKGGLLKSPIQLKGRAYDHGGYDKLVRDAVQLDKKIWNISKLDNILSRLLPSAPSKVKNSQQATQLTQLLQHERLHGTTSERDPRERRLGYQYFAKNSHFLLVEDIHGELAPVAIMEYPESSRGVEKDKAPAYPVLHMDPRARSPFVKFDEKEARRQHKIDTTEKLREQEKEKHRTRVKEQFKKLHEAKQQKTKSLRRCASLNQLGRRAVARTDLPNLGSDDSGGAAVSNSLGITDDKAGEQQIASGFGQSTTGLGTCNGYLAASGNSVGITSTNTTSYARTLGSGPRLPLGLREQLGRQVMTSRRFDKENVNPYLGEPRLRKAKSTTTMRLPSREESKKPGYCEACRVKFEDFKEHVRGARHRKFAQNENNYIDLDFLLRRLQRRFKTDESSATSSLEVDVNFEEDPPSDACLGPGDYFYLSPEVQPEEWEGDDIPGVPQIVVDEEL